MQQRLYLRKSRSDQNAFLSSPRFPANAALIMVFNYKRKFDLIDVLRTYPAIKKIVCVLVCIILGFSGQYSQFYSTRPREPVA